MGNNITLFIFDGSVDADKIAGLIARNSIKQVALFPLTGDLSLLQEIDANLISAGINDVFRYNTAALIDDQVARLREEICKWSADIGRSRVGRKSVKEWFLLPGCNISAWWFSLFVEKNPLKTDVFLRISQVNSIERALGEKKYDLVLLASGNKNLITAIKNVVSKSAIPVKIAPSARIGGWKDGLFIETFRGLRFYFNFIRAAYIAKRRLVSGENRFHKSRSILFVSYFPSIEKIPAQNGIFVNRYAPVLQDKLREAGLPVTWVLMYVPMDGVSFRDAVGTAKKFIDNGEKLFFLEEFLSVKDAVYGLFLWVRQVFISLFLFSFMDDAPLVSAPVGEKNRPFIRSLWNISFCGPTGAGGILFALTFRKMFRDIKNVTDCLYYFEMQPWEHALNSAKGQEQPDIRNIGFQHASVPKNSFGHFADKTETRRTADYTDLPLPDIVACNGRVTADLLAGSDYPAVTRLESIRYLYLDGVLASRVDSRQKRRALLVAGSASMEESTSLAMLVRSVFPRAGSFEICFKGHPHFPFEKIFDDLGIDAGISGYSLNHDDVSLLLGKAFAVITLSSTVAIEALAYGAEVIVPLFPDLISLNPLAGFEGYYHRVTGKDELPDIVENILRGRRLHDVEEYRRFVRRYWDIDKDIPGWMELLKYENK
jgi:surface carbohydrate biosynthesis protein (TIGR04326 family)